MNQPNFVELARCGDLHAISALITHSLKSQKITAHASSHGSQLQVLLEAETFPRQEALVKYIYQGIIKLNVPVYKSLIIYGKQLGKDKPIWERKFSLILQDGSFLSQPSEAESSLPESLPSNSSSDLSEFVLLGNKQQVNKRENQKLEENLPKSSALNNVLESSEKLVRSVKFLEKISLLVCILLWVEICFNILFLLYNIVWAISDGLYTILGIADTTGLLSSLINSVFQLMYEFWDYFESTDRVISRINGFGLLVWLYFLHAVLKWSFKSYPISPWGAVARYLIPCYNFWGIWNIFSTFSSYLIKNGESTVARKGEKLKRCFPRLYAGLFLSIFVNGVYYFIVANVGERDRILWWFYIGSSTISLVNSILYLQVVRISHRAVSEQSHQLINSPP